MFLVGILFGFLPVYINSLCYTQLVNGLTVGATAAAFVLIQPLAGRLADRFSSRKVILAELGLSATGLVLVPLTAGVMLAAVCVVAGMAVGTVSNNTDALVSSLAEQGRLAATLGAAGSFKELGDLLGPLLIGLFARAFGIKVGFLGCGLLGFATLGVLRSLRP